MLNKLKSSVTNQTKTKGGNKMFNKNNGEVNFDKNKGGASMFKTIGKAGKNIVKNSKVSEVVETKVRERKVKKIIKQVEKEKEETELRAIVDFVMDSIEKDEDVMERLKKLNEGDIEVVNERAEKIETKKRMFKKKTKQMEESEAYKEGKRIAEDMKDKVHDIFPVDKSSRFVGPFTNKKKNYVSKDVEEFGDNVEFYDEKEKKSFKGTFDEFMSNKNTKLFFGKKKGGE